MINHARTLLLNSTGEAAPRPDIYFDAYIPSYLPLIGLPHGVQRARDVLFGSSPDYQGRCMRVAQCLGVVAGTPYADYLRVLDPRITYDFARVSPPLFPVSSASDSGGRILSVSGAWTPPEATGRASYTWHLTWSGSVGTVRDWRGEQGVVDAATVVALPGSTLYVTASGLPVDGSIWRISYVVLPGPSLVSAVTAVLDDPAAMGGLFPADAQEPVRTFYALAANHALFPYRTAGVVLGMIWRMEAFRGT